MTKFTTGRFVAISMFAAAIASQPAQAQLDPRQPLNILISAFQNCGPPAAYQMLSPYLFQLISQQTGNRGCYPQIANAGAVTGMQLLQSQQFPIGPLYVVRVQHQSGAKADWFIGFDQFTGQVLYLSYQGVQSVQEPPPTIEAGPSPTGGGPTPPQPGGGGGGGGGNGDGCDLYPAMCG